MYALAAVQFLSGAKRQQSDEHRFSIRGPCGYCGTELSLRQLWRADVKAKEKAYSQALQQSGQWPHLWRVVGEYANYSVFDVPSNDALHSLLEGLPLFPYMDIQVTPLAKHPSAIEKTR